MSKDELLDVLTRLNTEDLKYLALVTTDQYIPENVWRRLVELGLVKERRKLTPMARAVMYYHLLERR